jgi:PTH1 family peptidyl-tRNA hydrolase
MKFRQEALLCGELAEGKIDRGKVLVLLPMTYMNNSGRAVQACMNYFKLGLEDMVVVVDDVAFDLGVLRLKKEGSSGGHNGLKSIEEHLKTSSYPRLRVGIGAAPQRQVLADYVLAKFSAGEQRDLARVLNKATDVLDLWVEKGDPSGHDRRK